MSTLYIISAPSGTGKTSLVSALISEIPEIQVSVSITTRPKRNVEKAGKSYIFTTENEFKTLVEKKVFLEHALVFGYHYGTSREWVENTLRARQDVILEIDWQGAKQVKQKMPDCVSIFILPPTLAALQKRLQDRGQDNAETISKRLGEARSEIAHFREYDYLVVNDNFEEALHHLKAIVQARRLSLKVQQNKLAKLIQALL